MLLGRVVSFISDRSFFHEPWREEIKSGSLLNIIKPITRFNALTWNHWIEQLNIFSYYFFQSTMVNFSDKLVSYFACYDKVRAISQAIWRLDVGVRPPYFVPSSNKQWIIELASYWRHCSIYIYIYKDQFLHLNYRQNDHYPQYESWQKRKPLAFAGVHWIIVIAINIQS